MRTPDSAGDALTVGRLPTSADVGRLRRPVAAAGRLAARWRPERLFVAALGVGILLRVLVQVAFPPGFVFSDGSTYIALAEELAPSEWRPIGYAVMLRALGWVDPGVDVIAVTQHLLGLAAAVAVYALLRRRGVSSPVATLATLPLLLDAMQLTLEHSVLSDVLFQFLLVATVVVLAWRPVPTLTATAAAGLLLSMSVLVRVVGGPAIVVVVGFLLLTVPTLRSKLVHLVVVTATFAVPVVGYAAWYHHEHGTWALTENGGRALYMRTTSFVECDEVSVPEWQRPLCPAEPVGERLEPTYYGFHDERTEPRVDRPAGVTRDQAMRDFARRVIRQQPADYVRVVLRDIALPFYSPHRDDWFEYDTAQKWTFEHRMEYEPSRRSAPAYEERGGEMPRARQPLAGWFADHYGPWVYLPGPLMLGALLLAIAGLVVRRPATAEAAVPRVRPLILLLVGTALVMVVVPAATAEFVWRYQLPTIVLLPPAAALAWARLRARTSPSSQSRPSENAASRSWVE